MAGRAEQRPGMVDREDVQRRLLLAVRILRHQRERELAVLAAALLDVEDRVEVVILDVHPDRMGRDDVGGRRRVRGNEVDLVGDVDLGRPRRQVVDHVVEDPEVLGADRIAVPLGQRVDRLLLARGHERVKAADVRVALTLAGGPVAEPHAMVEMDHVGQRDPATALAIGQRVLEVRRHPDHVAVDGRLRHAVGVEQDQVGARRDQERARGEMEMLNPCLRPRLSARGSRKRQRRCDHHHGQYRPFHLSPPSPGPSRRIFNHGLAIDGTLAYQSTRKVSRTEAVGFGDPRRRGLPGLRPAAVRAAHRGRNGRLEHVAALAGVDRLVGGQPLSSPSMLVAGRDGQGTIRSGRAGRRGAPDGTALGGLPAPSELSARLGRTSTVIAT